MGKQQVPKRILASISLLAVLTLALTASTNAQQRKVNLMVINSSSVTVDIFLAYENVKRTTLQPGNAAKVKVSTKATIIAIRTTDKMTARYQFEDVPCGKLIIEIEDKDFK